MLWLLVLLLGVCGALGQQTDPAEIQALNNFYLETNGDMWVDNDNWGVGDPCLNNWTGVFCQFGAVYIHVTDINLFGNNLVSNSFPTSLFQLPRLQYLDLSTNRISGNIPAEIGTLRELQALILFDNDLTGLVPVEIGQCTDLQNLNLAFNRLTGEIPPQIRFLTNLTQFVLSFTQMSGWLPVGIGDLRNLQYLDLQSSNFEGPIPAEIGQLTNLVIFNLFNNRFEGRIPTEIGMMSSLYFLDLEENFLEGVLPDEIYNLNVNIIYVRDNQLEGTISPLIGSVSWELIDFRDNKFEGTLPEISNPNLKEFLVGNNRLGGPLPISLLLDSNLHVLDLSSNFFEGVIPSEIGTNPNLLELNLNNNRFFGSIPSEIGNCPSLIFIEIADNMLSGEIPPEIGDMTELSVLDLSDNLLVGPIPESIAQLRFLVEFSVDYNFLVGTISPSFSIPNQTTFEITSNLFVGGLGDWVCDIQFFDARSNFFTCDDLPACCGYEGTRACIPCYDVPVAPFDPIPTPPPSSSPTPPPGSGTVNNITGLESATWMEKRLFFLGTERTIYEYEFKFSDEIHMVESVACETEPCTEPSNKTACDYSSLESYGCLEPELCTNASLVCSDEKNFTSLSEGVPVFVESQEANIFKQFRYFSDTQCKALSIRVAAKSGDPDLYVSTYTEPGIKNFEYREEGVYAYRGLISYDIVVEEIEFDFPPVPPPPPRENEADDTIELSNGRIHVARSLSLTKPQILTWEPDWDDYDNCYVHFESSGDTSLTVVAEYAVTGADDTISYEQVEFYTATSTRYEGRSWIALSYCDVKTPGGGDDDESGDEEEFGIEEGLRELEKRWMRDQGKKKKRKKRQDVEMEEEDGEVEFYDGLPARFQIAITGNGESAIFVTTHNVVRIENFLDYYAVDLVSQIDRRRYTSGLRYDFELPCLEEYDCDDIKIWAGATGNAMYPPVSAASLASFVIFEDDLPGISNSLFTYLDIPTQRPRFYGEDGVVYGSLEQYFEELNAIAKTLFVNLGRAFVKSDGKLITTPAFAEIRSTPATVTCDPSQFQELAEELVEFLENNFPTSAFQTRGEVGELIHDLVRIDAARYNTTWSACERQMYEFYDLGPFNWTRSLTYEAICLLTDDENACDEQECGAQFEGLYEVDLIEKVRDSLVDESCLEPDCANLFLNDFGEDVNFLRGRLCSTTTGNLDPNSLRVDALWYLNCKKEIFGPEKKGKRCLSDRDCFIQPNCSNGVCATLGTECSTDDDCIYESECNYFTQLCTTDPETAQNMFLKCFVDNMPTNQQQTLSAEIGISVNPNSIDYINALRDYFMIEDCIGSKGTGLNTSLPFRRRFDLNVLTSSFTDLYGCRCEEEAGELSACLDPLCNAPPACLFSVYNSLPNLLSAQEQTNKVIGCTIYIGEEASSPSTCLEQKVCNWLDESSFSFSDPVAPPSPPSSPTPSSIPSPSMTPPPTPFGEICSNPGKWRGGPDRDPTHFCAICLGDTLPCVEIFGLDDEFKCEDAHVCLTPDGGYLVKDSEWEEGECEERSGQCAGVCLIDENFQETACVSNTDGSWSVCFFEDLVTESECVSYGGRFEEVGDDDDDPRGECIFPHLTDKRECEAVGLKYFSCTQLDTDECNDYQNIKPTRRDYLTCFVSYYTRCLEEDCSAPSGICEDRVLVNTQTPDLVAPAWSCVIPFAKGEENDFCPPNSFVTQLGCVYQEYPYYNEDICTSVGGIFVNASETEEDCQAQGRGCESGETGGTGLLTDLSDEDCIACGGRPRYYFNWRDAEWIVGKVAKPQWLPRESFFINDIGETLNFIEMAYSVEKPILDDFVFSQESEGLCSSSIRVINAINYVACGCNGFEYAGTFQDPVGRTDIVFDTDNNDPNTDIGTDFDDICEAVTETTLPIRKNVCPSEPQTLVSTSTFLAFSGETSFREGIFVCLSVSAEYLAADDYTEPIGNPVSVSFLPRQTLDSVYEVVRNKNDVVVGQLIGDGVQVNVSSDLDEYKEFLPISIGIICFAVRDEISVSTDYTEYDIGILDPKTNIITPMNAREAPPQILALTDFLCFKEVEIYANNDFFPIAREKNYENIDVMTTAERVIAFLTAALYTLGILALLFFFTGVPVRVIWDKMTTNYIIGIQCFILYVFRAVYFYLLGTYVVPGDNEDVTDYILIEIPTFFFLGMFILIVLSFLFVYLRGYRDIQVSQRVFWLSFLAAELLIWLSFAAVVIALATLDQGGEEIRTCSKRLTEETISEVDDARVIRIAYKTAIAFLSLVVVTVLTALTVGIRQKGNVFFQVLFASFGLLFNSIAFIIYYAIDEPSTYFAIVLWFTELLPTLVMCLIVSPRRYIDGEKRSRMRDKSSSKSPHESSTFNQ